MQRFSRRGSLVAATVLITLAAGAIALPALPERMVVHVGLSGTPDSYAPRWLAVLLVPGLAVVTAGVLAAAFRVDAAPPGVERVVTAATMGLFGCLQLLVLAWNLGYAVPNGAVLGGVLLWSVGVTGYALFRESVAG
jgi:uncharacterized membrane protein